jgi:hypothetical protein
VIDMMKITGMPNGLSALGFGEDQLDALADCAEPQYRVIRNAPVDVGRDELKTVVPFGASLLVTGAGASGASGARCTRRQVA